MRRPLTLLLLAPLAAALIASGCGSDDGGGSSSDETATTTATQSGEPLTKAEFIASADEICAAGDAKIDAGGQAFAGTSAKVDELTHTVIVPGLKEEIAQLRALTPPEADQAQIDDFINTFEDGVDQLDEDPSQLAGGDAFKTIIKARQVAGDYGMKACSRGY